MENCDVKYKDCSRTLATKNVTASALRSLFGLPGNASLWLKDLSDTYVFPDENGIFPTLDPFVTYYVEVGPSQVEEESRTGSKRRRSKDVLSVSDESSDEDFRRTAYRLSVGGKKGGKKNDRSRSFGGKRPVPTPVATATDTASAWFFKVTVGDWQSKKIVPVRNCLIRCGDETDCGEIKRKLAAELKVTAAEIQLYDSDYLLVEESPGRIGKYWSGTRKIFAIITASSSNTPSAKSGVQCLISKQLFDESLTPIISKLESLDRKMEKMQVFLLKGCETVYKDISLFSREIFKCPICFGTTKDEIPHATSCCNHVFCLECINELAARNNTLCPLCKQKRGPLYPILLSGVNDLVQKVSCIPNLPENTESNQ